MRPTAAIALVLAGTVLAGCAQNRPAPAAASDAPESAAIPSASATAPTSLPGTCTAVAEKMTPAEQAGQVLMVGLSSSPDDATMALLRGTHVGGVVLTGPLTTGVEGVKGVTGSLDAGMLVAAQQEGGAVQPLSGPGFDTIPGPADQAKLTPADLRARWGAWGRQLKDAGVLLNLAPTADVVPAANQATSPVAGRSFGSDPQKVADAVASAVSGIEDAGLAASLRTFPGLGTAVSANGKVTDSTTTMDAALSAPVTAAIAAGVDVLVVPLATFTQLDAGAPAVFSAPVVGLVRDGLRFPGVLASDDLAGPGAASVPAGQRALGFLKAGGDLAVTSDPALATAMAKGLTDAAASDPAVKARLAESAANVLGLKSKLGLVQCEAVRG